MKYILCLLLASCTMFAKTQATDELDELVDDAVKAKRDVSISIKTTPEAK